MLDDSDTEQSSSHKSSPSYQINIIIDINARQNKNEQYKFRGINSNIIIDFQLLRNVNYFFRFLLLSHHAQQILNP